MSSTPKRPLSFPVFALIIVLGIFVLCCSCSAIAAFVAQPKPSKQVKQIPVESEPVCLCTKTCDEMNSCEEAIECLSESCNVDSLDPDENGIPCEQSLCAEDETFKVTRIIDGDTIEVLIGDTKEKVRLIGIDTPELQTDCFAQEAKEQTQKLILNQFVLLEPDQSQGDKDKYNRLLRYVFLKDKTNIIEELIKNGYGKEYTYDKPYIYQKLFKDAQESAKQDKKGLWGDACMCEIGEEVSRTCSACNQATVTYYKSWSCDTDTKTETDTSCTNDCTVSIPKTIESTTPAVPTYTCDCSKTCDEISSCTEAYYQLNTCGCTRRDGDNDGVPCETLCN